MALEGVEVEEDSKGVAATIEGGWGEQKDDGNVSYTRMLKFILPTLGIWLASPIMSLVDAGVVGEDGVTKGKKKIVCYLHVSAHTSCRNNGIARRVPWYICWCCERVMAASPVREILDAKTASRLALTRSRCRGPCPSRLHPVVVSLCATATAKSHYFRTNPFLSFSVSPTGSTAVVLRVFQGQGARRSWHRLAPRPCSAKV